MFVKYFMSLRGKAVYKHKHYYGKSMNKVINQIEQKKKQNLKKCYTLHINPIVHILTLHNHSPFSGAAFLKKV